jgi:hypothetical protein
MAAAPKLAIPTANGANAQHHVLLARATLIQFAKTARVSASAAAE